MKNIINNERKELFLLARNEINTISFKNLKTKEIDLFYFYLIALKENKMQPVTISFIEIRKILDIKQRNSFVIENLIWNSHDSLLSLNFWILIKDKKLGRHILDKIDIDKKNKLVTISINNDFKKILTNLDTGNFTKIDFFELRNLKLMYSKKLYPILKQQSSGKVYLKDINKFREQLSINKNYQFKDIKKQILTPAIKELSKIFPNLKLETKKVGNKIIQIGFSFSSIKNKKIVTKKVTETKNKKEKNVQKNSLKKDNHKLEIDKTNFDDYHKNELNEYENPLHIQKELEEIW